MLAENPPPGLLITGQGIFLRLATYNSQAPHSRTSRPKTAGSGRGTGHTGRSRGYCRGPSRPGRAGQRPAKPPTSTTDKPPDTARRRHTTRYTEHRNTPKNRLRDGRETRHRAGRPPRFPPPPRRPADKAADGAGLKIWPACKCACLGLVGGLAGGFPRPVGGRSPRPPWQGGRLIFFPLVQLLPFTAPYGEQQRPILPPFR